MDMQPAIEHLDTFGYCVIEDAIPAKKADSMAQTYLRHHQDPVNRRFFENPNDDLYQTLFGTINRDEMCWGCVAHPQVLVVVRHFIGARARLGEACTKWVKPGAPVGPVHVDSTHDLGDPLPDIPWLINTMWMITDFTKDNGPTLVVPFSHMSVRRPLGVGRCDKRLLPVTGRRGSVILWHGGIWHANGANTSDDQHRMGLNIAYYPAWWNCAREGGHQPVWPDVFERMPNELRELCRHKVGRERDDVYE